MAAPKMASIVEGPLSKWTNVMKGWQYRWFVLDYNAGLLSYYTVSARRAKLRATRRPSSLMEVGPWVLGGRLKVAKLGVPPY